MRVLQIDSLKPWINPGRVVSDCGTKSVSRC